MTFRATTETPPTVASRMVKRVVQLAAVKRLDGEAMARACGIDPAVLADPDGRVAVSASDALVEALDREAGGPMLGVELAFTRDPETYDAAGVALLAAPTLRAGLDRAFRCQVLWGDGERFRRDGDAILFDPVPEPRDGERPPHRRAHEIVTECALAEACLAARFVAPTARPARMELAYPAHDREEVIAGAMGAPVRSGARRSAMVLTPEILDAPMPAAALDALALVPSSDAGSLTDRVRAAAARATIVGDATIVTVSDRLGLPPRTLQRRLAEEGVTFGSIVEEERARLAHAWLKAGLSIREIGGLLGYADKASFYRAFRKWTGTTPHEARGRIAERALPSGRP